ncbi:MAG: exodeoxyribonuclease III [Sphingobacteriales bacterium]|nr:MAG: exodeoxyribonuclease III [Sphingobacteriales bacterium]
MKIVSYNVNGLRAAIKKGLLDWLVQTAPDVLCLQEVKALQTDIDLSLFESLGYQCHWFGAEKKGYSGVATFTKEAVCEHYGGTGHGQSDAEGRVLRTDIGDLTVINAYFPSGTTGSVRQTYKMLWLDQFYDWLTQLHTVRKQIILCGDYNIAHTEVDLHNPKGNTKTSGFLPEERLWMDRLTSGPFVDTFRHLHPETTDSYSWWSQRFPHLRDENKGWRIDYICASKELVPYLQTVTHLKDAVHSDHCPVALTLDWNLM